MEALEEANRVRLSQTELKREIRAGATTVTEALYDPRAERLSLAKLLKAQTRWGDQRVARFLLQVKIGHERRVGQLTTRQRRAVAAALTA